MKMAVVQLLALLTVAGLTAGRNITVQNNLTFTIRVGILGNAGEGTPGNGGFDLISGARRTVQVALRWAGRFWARRFNGSSQGHCATGDCGDKLSYNGTGGILPVTLAEITLNGDGGKDIYDVSLVEGFNVPVQIKPKVGGGKDYSCTTAGCTKDLNPGCPDALKVWENDTVIACKSSCLANDTDENCCRGAYNNANDCSNSTSAVYFNSNCPETYRYPFIDGKGTFTCQNTDYDIIFGY